MIEGRAYFSLGQQWRRRSERASQKRFLEDSNRLIKIDQFLPDTEENSSITGIGGRQLSPGACYTNIYYYRTQSSFLVFLAPFQEQLKCRYFPSSLLFFPSFLLSLFPLLSSLPPSLPNFL